LTRFLAATALLLIAALVQSILGPSLPIVGGRPDLVLVAVLAWAMLRGPTEGTAVGFIGGLLLDSVDYFPFGLNGALLGLAGYITGVGQANLYRGNLPIFLAMGALASVVYHGAVFLGLQAFGFALPPIVDGYQMALRAAILNAMLLVPALFLCHRILGMLAGWQDGSV
jgi:rod shape-determining protein MreD